MAYVTDQLQRLTIHALRALRLMVLARQAVRHGTRRELEDGLSRRSPDSRQQPADPDNSSARHSSKKAMARRW